ncbi:MAG TPA: c-type cytochrome [Bryobacteraceae bacterium]|nr:c-type cytochrome [Bryobacteraceae bacterium]
MKRTLSLFAITGLALLGAGWSAAAQAQKEVKKVPVTPTRADSGVAMFKTYCASCHGMDGKGNGPAADALKMPPANLTLLKQKNGGKFPGGKVSQIIDGENEVRAHGTSEMPLWGPVFRSMDPSNLPVVKLRIANLTKYIESIQQ